VSELAVYGWFRVLDGKSVEIGVGVWRIVLYSVRMIDEGQWLQLLLVGEPTYEMTLRLPWAGPTRSTCCGSSPNG